jgi:hypothetical protein
MIDGALLTMRKGKDNYGWERSLNHAHMTYQSYFLDRINMDCCQKKYREFGVIHKQRLLRGGGRGSPLKADLLNKPI